MIYDPIPKLLECYSAEKSADKIIIEIVNRGFTTKNVEDVKGLREVIVECILSEFAPQAAETKKSRPMRPMTEEERETADEFFDTLFAKAKPLTKPESLQDLYDNYFWHYNNPQNEIT